MSLAIIDSGIDRRSENSATGLLKSARNVERRLTAELNDDAHRFFGLVYLENVLDGHGLEVELVRRVVVGRNGFGVAVDDNRLVAHLAHGHRRVAAAVVELYSLADAVRAAAENHHLLRVGRHLRLAERGVARLRVVVGRVVVSLVLDAGDRNRKPALFAAERTALRTDVFFGHAEKLGDVFVAEAVFLRLDEQAVGESRSLFPVPRSPVLENLLFLLHEFAHLVHEVALHASALEYLLVRRALPQGLVHLEVPLGVRHRQKTQKLVERKFVEVLREAEPRPAALQRAYRLLECLLVGFADGHHLADGLHLRAELVLHRAELLESPARELENHVVAVGRVLLERSVAPVGNLVHRHARGELGRNERDRETRRLRRERRRARRSRIDFDDDDAPRLRVVGELHVRAADHADGLDDLESVAFEPLF